MNVEFIQLHEGTEVTGPTMVNEFVGVLLVWNPGTAFKTPAPSFWRSELVLLTLFWISTQVIPVPLV